MNILITETGLSALSVVDVFSLRHVSSEFIHMLQGRERVGSGWPTCTNIPVVFGCKQGLAPGFQLEGSGEGEAQH